MLDSHYQSTLSNASLRIAIKELNENPRTRLIAAKDLRSWIEEQPHITFQTDCRLLLRFLRVLKFNQITVRRQIERYLQAMQALPDWWTNIDAYCPKLLALLKTGFLTELGIDDNGRVNVLLIIGKIDPNSTFYNENHCVRVILLYLYSHMYNEEQQVNGVVFHFDNSGYTPDHQRFLCMDMLRKGSKMFQGTFPCRWKSFHYYNAGAVFENMYAVIRPILKKKIKDRVYFHRSIQALRKQIPARLLPVEYITEPLTRETSKNLTMQQLNDRMFEHLTSSDTRDQVLALTSDLGYSIDMANKQKTEEQTEFYRKVVPD